MGKALTSIEGKNLMTSSRQSDKATKTPVTELYFCPNGNVARRIGRKDFLEEKKGAIRLLHELDKRWNLVIPGYFVLWLASAWVAVRTDLLFINIACYVIGGMALGTLSVLAHESTHNLFTHNPKIDRWIGFLCALPILFSPTGYRIIHPYHHKNARTENDPDDIENVTSNSKLLSLLYSMVLLFGVYLYLVVVPVKSFQRATNKKRIVILLECGFMAALLVSAWSMFGTNVMVEAWLIPLLIAGQIGNIRGLAEHGLTSQGNELIDTRTVVAHPVISFLMCNINYHLEHHLYPGVPWYNLPKLHQLLEEDYKKAGASVYTSYGSFLMDFYKALKSGIVPGSRLIPAHLREEVCL